MNLPFMSPFRLLALSAENKNKYKVCQPIQMVNWPKFELGISGRITA
jgi:hypothetical protein